jgi:hypothetical protein
MVQVVLRSPSGVSASPVDRYSTTTAVRPSTVVSAPRGSRPGLSRGSRSSRSTCIDVHRHGVVEVPVTWPLRHVDLAGVEDLARSEQPVAAVGVPVLGVAHGVAVGLAVGEGHGADVDLASPGVVVVGTVGARPAHRSGDVDPPVLVSRASLTCAVDLTTGLGVRSGADPAARRPRRSAALLDLSTLAMALPDAAQGRSPVLVGVSRSRSRSRSP